MAPVHVRPAKFTDVGRLHNLFVHAIATDFKYFPQAYIDQVKQQNSFWRLLKSMLNSQRIILLAVSDNKPVGYLIGSAHRDGEGELYWLYVRPDARGHRLGKTMVERAITLLAEQGMREVTLVTYDYDRFYHHLGFEYAGKHAIADVELHKMHYQLRKSDGA